MKQKIKQTKKERKLMSKTDRKSFDKDEHPKFRFSWEADVNPIYFPKKRGRK